MFVYNASADSNFLAPEFEGAVIEAGTDLSIYNGTSHCIFFYREEDTVAIQGGRKLVRKEGAKPFAVVMPGTNLNAVKENREAPQLTSAIPLKGGVVFTGAHPIPEGYDIVVVSNLYRSACAELGWDISCLATVDGSVYEDESAIRPCGVLGLAVG
jgi:hypothetical protein